MRISVLVLPLQSQAASVRPCFPLCVEMMDRLTQILARQAVRESRLGVMESVLVNRMDDLFDLKPTIYTNKVELGTRFHIFLDLCGRVWIFFFFRGVGGLYIQLWLTI